jgi:myo-inositol-1(or 4)-monophosphatase
MHPFLNTASKAAFKAGELMVQALDHIDHIKIQEKSTNNFVTEVDRASESLIIETLHQAYPDHDILAEEGGNVIDTGASHQWIIDPLDGTTNFTHGFPHFCISIALMVDGRIEHALVYEPIRQDLYTASRGQGAYKNDRRIRVSKRHKLASALITSCMPPRTSGQRDYYLALCKALSERAQTIRISGAAALDMAFVAAGNTDGFWAASLKPWDIAAGALLIKEAGGIVSDFKGGTDFLESGDVLAGNTKVYKQLAELTSTVKA